MFGGEGYIIPIRSWQCLIIKGPKLTQKLRQCTNWNDNLLIFEPRAKASRKKELVYLPGQLILLTGLVGLSSLFFQLVCLTSLSSWSIQMPILLASSADMKTLSLVCLFFCQPDVYILCICFVQLIWLDLHLFGISCWTQELFGKYSWTM